MRKFRTVVNLISFFVIALGLVIYGIVDLLGNPLQHPTVVSATFADASGVQPNFGVVLNGVVVGSVQRVQLVPHGAKVFMSLEPGQTVPDDVVAEVGLANDLGEQQIELTPKHAGAAPPLRNGESIPVVPGGIPTEVGSVVRTTTRLLGSLGVSQVNSLLATLSQALSGRASDLRSILESSTQFSQEFLSYQRQFQALLASSPPVLNGLASDGPQLRQDLAATAVLADTLRQHRYDLVHLLSDGGKAAVVATELLDGTRANLGCLLHDSADLSANVASPQNLSDLSVGLATNQWFFGAIEAVSPTGPAKSLYPGDPYNADQEWLRTRLFLPPKSPSANEYSSPVALPPTEPGAACIDEFGHGVGPASQQLAQFPVAGGSRTIAPTAAEAHVSGGGAGDPSEDAAGSGSGGSTGELASYAVPASRPAASWAAWLGIALALLIALTLLLPRRRRYAGRDTDSRSTPLNYLTIPLSAARARVSRPQQSRKDRP